MKTPAPASVPLAWNQSSVIPGRRVAASPETITTAGAVVFVYLLASSKHGTLYIGVTNDLVRRVQQHKLRVNKGFTSRCAVDRLVWYENYDDPISAIAREKE